MGRKSKSKSESLEDEFTLDDVLKLGGTKEEFETLKELQDGAVSKTKRIKDTLKDEEFKNFFKSVGFDKIEAGLEISDEDEVESNSKPLEQSIKTQKKVVDADVSSKPTITSLPKSVLKKKIQTKKSEEKIKKTKKSKFDNKEKREITLPAAKKMLPGPLQDIQISSSTDEISTVLSSPSALPAKVFTHIFDLGGMTPKKLVLKPAGPWHSNDISKTPPSKKIFESTDSIILKLKSFGNRLLENEGNLYKNRTTIKDSGNESWMKTVISSGTLSDRVAAYTLMLQNAPIHNYWCLDTFLGMLKKKGKREAIIGLEALRDIFLSELLPDRKLKFFHNQPFEHLEKIFNTDAGNATSKRLGIQRHLIQWAYEDRIKSSYKQLVESLKDFFLQDSLENVKSKGMKVALELLQGKPEQERELLTMLVNKLGDPKYKIASKGLHMLHCLIQEHPVMQCVIVNAVRDLLLRPNIQPKCQYYCICFLSSQILSHDRKDVADTLIQIYLGFFKAAIKKKQVDNKLLSAILTGVNRAYPYSNSNDAKIIEELNVLFRTVHVSSFGTTVQALMLLFQVLSSREELSDRYYNALYSTLLHTELPICTNRHPMYLNLLFRSLKADSSESRVQAFLKRLLQTCSLQLAAYSSAVLVLITELLRFRPSLKCYLESKGLEPKKSNDKFDNDDDEEHFIDVDETVETDDSAVKPEGKDEKDQSKVDNSWTHLHKKSNHRHSSTYDPTHRNPTFANAENTSLWELYRIRCHFHPTVVKFATEIHDIGNKNEPDRYPGDPLQDFTLMRFLDKFVYRNPKARPEKEMGANTGESLFRRKRKLTMAETRTVAANTPEFLNKKTFNPEEVFLQRYFMSRAANAPHSEKDKKSEVVEYDSDIEEVSDNEFDQFLSSADGKAELDKQYNFADGAMGSKNKKRKLDLVQDSDDDEDGAEFDEIDDGEDIPEDDFAAENPFDEGGMTFDDPDDMEGDDMPDESPKKKGNKFTKTATADVEAFDMMLEEHSHNKSNTSGSGAVRNSDRSSAKQLNWEQKREMKDIVARKRAQKRGGFSKQGKQPKFDAKKMKKFSGKKFQKGRHSR